MSELCVWDIGALGLDEERDTAGVRGRFVVGGRYCASFQDIEPENFDSSELQKPAVKRKRSCCQISSILELSQASRYQNPQIRHAKFPKHDVAHPLHAGKKAIGSTHHFRSDPLSSKTSAGRKLP